jgi:hypothetical protein
MNLRHSAFGPMAVFTQMQENSAILPSNRQPAKQLSRVFDLETDRDLRAMLGRIAKYGNRK